MTLNILETNVDLEFTSNSLSSKSSQCNDGKISTSDVKGYPVLNNGVKHIIERYRNFFKNLKLFIKAYFSNPIKKSEIISEENCSPEETTVKDLFISKMEKFCDNYQDVVEPLDFYRHSRKIKSECSIHFYKLIRMNRYEEFLTNYYLKHKRLEIELDNVFVDIYNENKTKILPL